MAENEDFESIIGEAPVVDETNPLNLQRAGVIGAGTMGQGIAQMMAANGIDVILVEKDNKALESSLQELNDNMDREIERWGMTASEKRAILARIDGTTDYVEAIQIVYQPDRISYQTLLELFWKQIDPTDSEGQFVDRGKQYTTAIYYHTEEQRKLALESRDALEASGRFERPMVTSIKPFTTFYPAEDDH